MHWRQRWWLSFAVLGERFLYPLSWLACPLAQINSLLLPPSFLLDFRVGGVASGNQPCFLWSCRCAVAMETASTTHTAGRLAPHSNITTVHWKLYYDYSCSPSHCTQVIQCFNMSHFYRLNRHIQMERWWQDFLFHVNQLTNGIKYLDLRPECLDSVSCCELSSGYVLDVQMNRQRGRPPPADCRSVIWGLLCQCVRADLYERCRKRRNCFN